MQKQTSFIIPLLGGLFLLLSFFSITPDEAFAARGRSGQKVFATTEEALAELKAAIKAQDSERMVEIFGDPSEALFFTGDPAADAAALKRLSIRFEQRAELLPISSAEFKNEQWYRVRYGIEAWNMRVPLVNRGKGWSFATEYATQVDLRVRRAINEVYTVDTLRALVHAQAKYKGQDRNKDGVQEYARKFRSSPGKKDGLYWPAEPNQPVSPLDGIVARAIEAGYVPAGKDTPTYGGYVYKILTKQGRNARGGARSYLVDDKLTAGFAILAYPIKWRASGDATFVVGPDGQVWKKDLGVRTASIASKIDELNRDRTWLRVDPNLGGKNSRVNW